MRYYRYLLSISCITVLLSVHCSCMSKPPVRKEENPESVTTQKAAEKTQISGIPDKESKENFDPTISLASLERAQQVMEAFHRAIASAAKTGDIIAMALLKRDAEAYVANHINIISSEYKNIRNSMKEAPAAASLYYACESGKYLGLPSVHQSCLSTLEKLTPGASFMTYDGKVFTVQSALTSFGRKGDGK